LHRQVWDLIDEFAETLELSGLMHHAFYFKKLVSVLAHFLQYLIARFKVVKIAMICNEWSKSGEVE
jgi:hypothetical protein